MKNTHEKQGVERLYYGLTLLFVYVFDGGTENGVANESFWFGGIGGFLSLRSCGGSGGS
jgi:hypothetical protein